MANLQSILEEMKINKNPSVRLFAQDLSNLCHLYGVEIVGDKVGIGVYDSDIIDINYTPDEYGLTLSKSIRYNSSVVKEESYAVSS